MLPRRTGLSLAFAFTVIAMVGFPNVASAISVTLNATAITRTVPLRTDSTTKFWISKSDCLAGDILTFPTLFADYSTASAFEVWATDGSTDCTDPVNRTSATTALCWRVYDQMPTSNTSTVSINTQDIVAAVKPDSIGQGSVSSCTSAASGTGAQPLTLFFMFLSGSDNLGGATWTTSVDLVGPDPPTGIGLGKGSNLLKVSWTQNTNADVAGYRFYCDSDMTSNVGVLEAGVNSSGTGGAAGAGGAGGDVCPDSSSLDAGDDAEGAGGADGAACVSSSSTASEDDATVGTSTCASPRLLPGAEVTPAIEAFRCGSVTGMTPTSFTIKGLANGTTYTVAVATFDLVQNVGNLSTVLCDFPEPVNGFFELYRDAGGNAGGGSFCAMGYRKRAAGAGGFAATFLLGLGLALRRGRRARPRRVLTQCCRDDSLS